MLLFLRYAFNLKELYNLDSENLLAELGIQDLLAHGGFGSVKVLNTSGSDFHLDVYLSL